MSNENKEDDSHEMTCPWCNDPKCTGDLPDHYEGTTYCSKCHKHFVWHRQVEYTYTTRRIKFLPKE